MPNRDDAPRRQRGRRSLLIGLCSSAGIHLVLLLWPVNVALDRELPGAHPDQPRAESGILLLALDAGEERVVLVPPSSPRDETTSDDDAPTDAEALGSEPEMGNTSVPAVRRLAPSVEDPRLWMAPPAPTDLELEIDAGRYFMRRATDSTATTPITTHGAATWTTANNWGLSPGAFRLGSVTIPTCGGNGANLADCGFGIAPNRRDGYNEWRWRFDDIERHIRRSAIESMWEKRASATRARRNAERDSIRPPARR